MSDFNKQINRWAGILVYNTTSGKLYWDCGHRKNLEAGTLDTNGYKRFKYDDRMYLVHRVVFEIMYGWIPDLVDHIDGNPSNNLHTNLRAATSSENQVNQPKSIKNTSGAKNVYWVEEHQKWRVRVQIQGQRFDFGYYDDFEDAALVAETARKQIHKEFANHE